MSSICAKVGEPLDITEARREFGGSIVKTIMDKGWLSTKAVAIDRDPPRRQDVPVQRATSPHRRAI